jgi:uncharacterized protein YndB with AHSA1/START domain
MTENAIRTIVLERDYPGSAERVWELWTTAAGIESWWGPEGFAVTVDELDLRPGGQLVYTMTAVEAPQIEFMNRAGMPLATTARVTYETIDATRLLAFITLADFIPEVEPYEVTTRVTIAESGERVKLTVTLDVMHDEHWTNLSRMGEESQLDRLGALLEG